MKIKHVANDVQSMSQDGGKILKSLQNNSMSPIDIVVRESLQNSLDATIEGEEVTKVQFKIDKFSSDKLSPIFEELDQLLIERYTGFQDFLAISDRGTYGLTGDYKSNNMKVLDQSNFHKLVFGIGKNQSKEGAGGSWGYGKTSYFRLGVGIVIYYTRILIDSVYEERLIASIIEDPTDTNRLLRNNERGIAWWGEFSDDSNERIYPITDSNEIREILDIFCLNSYSDNETGTTIIIPYLREINKQLIDDEAINPPWEHNYEDAISMAVQRWYFPRLWNNNYQQNFDKSYLVCTVNDRALHPDDYRFEPIFKIYQEIYTSALLGKAMKSNISVYPILLGRNGLKNTSESLGYIAFREVSFDELRMTPPDNKMSGLVYLGITDKSLINHPSPRIIGYCRKPGMVVEYNVNSLWASNTITLKEEHVLLGFFVPNSSAILLDRYSTIGYPTLETYLRSIEKSDHAVWEDDVDFTIIKRIRERVTQTITNSYQEDKDSDSSSATSGIARKFGSMLLPKKNFGKRSTISSNGVGNSGGGSKSRDSEVMVISTNMIDESSVEVTFKIKVKAETRNQLFIQILTQDKERIDIVKWSKIMGDSVPYPFKIIDISVHRINNEFIRQSLQNYQNQELQFNLNSNNGTVEIVAENSFEIEGTVILNVQSNQYIPNIAIRTL